MCTDIVAVRYTLEIRCPYQCNQKNDLLKENRIVAEIVSKTKLLFQYYVTDIIR